MQFKRQSAHFIHPETLRNQLNSSAQHWHFTFTQQTTSTNNDALSELKSLPASQRIPPFTTVHLTHQQTAGRGRLKRPWNTQPGQSLICSIGYIFNRPIHQLTGLSALIGIILKEALQQYIEPSHFQIKLKWPNDLLLYRSNELLGKLAGILIETAWSTKQTSAIVIGFGINLEYPSFAHKNFRPAALSQTGYTQNINTILANILNNFSHIMPLFEQQGIEHFYQKWNQYHAFQQEKVSLFEHQKMIAQGTALGINQNGQFLLESKDGIHTFHTGDISLQHQSQLPQFLLIDIGNSRVKWAVSHVSLHFIEQGSFDIKRLASSQSLEELIAHCESFLSPTSIWISNVSAQEAEQHLRQLILNKWPNCTITSIKAQQQAFGITNHYTQPEQLGSDRWAGLIGAKTLFSEDALLIATLGTATTIEALTKKGEFIGGLILPGLSLMLNALNQGTAKLPEIMLEQALQSINTEISTLANNTKDAIILGCLLSQANLLKQTWKNLCEQYQTHFKLIISGGNAHHLTPLLDMPHTTIPSLTLIGLAQIARTTSLTS